MLMMPFLQDIRKKIFKQIRNMKKYKYVNKKKLRVTDTTDIVYTAAGRFVVHYILY